MADDSNVVTSEWDLAAYKRNFERAMELIQARDARLQAIRNLHRRSESPASSGDHKGRHYCIACTTSVDDFTAYVDYPCKTATFAGAMP